MVLLSGRDLLTDHAPQWAAAVAYYGLLSLFPLLLAGISIASYFVDAQWAIQQVTRFLGEFVPRGEGQVDQIIREAIDARDQVSLLSLAALVWTGSRVFGVLTTALNIAYDVEETYGFWKRLLVEVVWTVAMGLLFLLALSSGFLLDLLWGALRILPAERGTVFRVIKWLVPGFLLFMAYFLTYKFVPRGRQDWRAAAIGAGGAALLFLVARPLFLSYIQQFGQYNLIYGSIAVVIILLVWAWLVALITLFGGELASHYQMMILEGQPAAEVEQRHAERSPEKKQPTASSDRPRPATRSRTRVVRPQRQG
jgi:membrane protein